MMMQMVIWTSKIYVPRHSEIHLLLETLVALILMVMDVLISMTSSLTILQNGKIVIWTKLVTIQTRSNLMPLNG